MHNEGRNFGHFSPNTFVAVNKSVLFRVVGRMFYVKLYRVEQEECATLREGVPYVKLYRKNPKHLYPKLNGLGDNGQ